MSEINNEFDDCIEEEEITPEIAAMLAKLNASTIQEPVPVPEISRDEMGMIYMIINKRNEKIYIGRTVAFRNHRNRQHEFGPESRLKEHFSRARNGIIGKFYDAIREFGEDQFKCEIVEECHVDELSVREKHYIAHFDSMNNGYNATSGGEPGRERVQISDRPLQRKDTTDGNHQKYISDNADRIHHVDIRYHNSTAQGEYIGIHIMMTKYDVVGTQLAVPLSGRSVAETFDHVYDMFIAADFDANKIFVKEDLRHMVEDIDDYEFNKNVLEEFATGNYNIKSDAEKRYAEHKDKFDNTEYIRMVVRQSRGGHILCMTLKLRGIGRMYPLRFGGKGTNPGDARNCAIDLLRKVPHIRVKWSDDAKNYGN